MENLALRQQLASFKHFSIIDFHGERLAELAVDTVVIVDKELRLGVECDVSDLLLHPFECGMSRDADLHYLTAPEFHDDEDVQDREPDRVLDTEIVGLVRLTRRNTQYHPNNPPIDVRMGNIG